MFLYFFSVASKKIYDRKRIKARKTKKCINNLIPPDKLHGVLLLCALFFLVFLAVQNSLGNYNFFAATICLLFLLLFLYCLVAFLAGWLEKWCELNRVVIVARSLDVQIFYVVNNCEKMKSMDKKLIKSYKKSVLSVLTA